MKAKPKLHTAIAAACTVLMAIGSNARAQTSAPGGPLGSAPFGTMQMLLERTIFKIDVLRLDLCFDQATAERFASIVGDGRTDGVDDALALEAIDTRRAIGTIRFLRDIELSQFLDGVREEQERAVEAELLADSTFRAISDSLPVWFDFLDERGIRDGDRMIYVFDADSIRTLLRDADGEVMLDRMTHGRSRVTSVLATWFAPGSRFRDPLLDSLGESDGPAVCEPPAGPAR